MVTAERVKTRQEQRADELRATIEGAIERLAEQLAAGHTEHFLELLKFWGSLHSYSHGNLLLIWSQRSDATAVAGYRKWQKLGRQVKQGAKAITIWCPLITKEVDEKTGMEVEVLTGFNPCPVFAAEDLTDIAERPLPNLWQKLPDDQEALFQQVKSRIEAAGYPVEERKLPRGVQGASNLATGAITLTTGMDSRSRVAVLIHEAAHSLFHREEEGQQLDRAQKEFDSEACAFVVCSALGFDYPSASDYLISWGGSADHLKASLPRIHLLVKRLLGIVLPKDRRAAEAA